MPAERTRARYRVAGIGPPGPSMSKSSSTAIAGRSSANVVALAVRSARACDTGLPAISKAGTLSAISPVNAISGDNRSPSALTRPHWPAKRNTTGGMRPAERISARRTRVGRDGDIAVA